MITVVVLIDFMFLRPLPLLIIYASPFPVPPFLSSFIKPNPLFKTRMSTQHIAPLIDEDCLFLFIHIHCELKRSPLTPFQQQASTLRQMALARMLVIVSTIFILTASPVVALSITTSVVYDFFINRRYTNIFLACHLVLMELGMINSGGGQLLHLRPEVVKVSPGTGKICVLPVFEAR